MRAHAGHTSRAARCLLWDLGRRLPRSPFGPRRALPPGLDLGPASLSLVLFERGHTPLELTHAGRRKKFGSQSGPELFPVPLTPTRGGG